MTKKPELYLDTATGQTSLLDGEAENQAFVDKFKAKVTTDDCYTPENIYNAVADWVSTEYGISSDRFIRPFWPGADYQTVNYPTDAVVVDNPPFSIRNKIIDFYLARGICFFLFSPALTLLTKRPGVCHLAVGATITYANTAEVPTSFVTNLQPDTIIRTAPTLYKAIKAENTKNLKEQKRQLPKYEYPDEIITAAIVQRWCHYGIEYALPSTDAINVSALDSQREQGKSIFGGGLLLTERAAAERAAAERAAAERAAAERAAATVWPLSNRERLLTMGIVHEQLNISDLEGWPFEQTEDKPGPDTKDPG